MNNLEIILSAAAAALPLVAAFLTFLIKMIASIKNNREERKQRLWTELSQEAVEFAESLKAKNNGELLGSTKKDLALNKVESACIKFRVPFDKDMVSDIIEKIVELTKKVNSRDKDKELNAVSTSPLTSHFGV